MSESMNNVQVNYNERMNKRITFLSSNGQLDFLQVIVASDFGQSCLKLIVKETFFFSLIIAPSTGMVAQYIPTLMVLGAALVAYRFLGLDVYFEELIHQKDLRDSYEYIIGEFNGRTASKSWEEKLPLPKCIYMYFL